MVKESLRAVRSRLGERKPGKFAMDVGVLAFGARERRNQRPGQWACSCWATTLGLVVAGLG